MTWGAYPNFSPPARDLPPLKDRLVEVFSRIPAKVLANATGSTEKAAERWKAGDNSPNAEALVKLCAHFDEVWDAVRQQACRDTTDAERMLDQMAELMKRRTA